MNTIDVHGTSISYEIRPSRRARRLGLTVYPGGRVVLTAPLKVSVDEIDRFLKRSAAWILRAYAKHVHITKILPRGKKDYQLHKENARKLVTSRLIFFNRVYGYNIGAITVRNNKSRWGSCSRKGDLSFNYKVIHLPPELADYIVVHELCHLGEFNHSAAFWKLVSKALPDYLLLRKRLRRIAQ